jgi:hypothetical protein
LRTIEWDHDPFPFNDSYFGVAHRPCEESGQQGEALGTIAALVEMLLSTLFLKLWLLSVGEKPFGPPKPKAIQGETLHLFGLESSHESREQLSKPWTTTMNMVAIALRSAPRH